MGSEKEKKKKKRMPALEGRNGFVGTVKKSPHPL